VRVREPVPATTEDARAEREAARSGVEVDAANTSSATTDDPWRGEGIVIDGLLGTGATDAPRGPIAAAVTAMRAMRERGASVVAIDMPTGIDATSGKVHLPARADFTFTYGTLKRGHLITRAACGRIVVLDIGLGAHADLEDGAPGAVSGAWVAGHLPEFPADAHKGTRKKLAIVGGGPGMSGAAILAARGAWRSGIGMVKLVVADESLASVREAEPQAMTAAWPTTDADAARDIGSWADVVAIGPGLSAGSAGRAVVERVLGSFNGPVVLDADAINAFASNVNAMAQLFMDRKGAAVLTPHPAEFARLAGLAVDDVLARRFDVARAVAAHTRAVVLLKGQPTVITSPAGNRLVSATGTPLLAAAGSGDVLTGMVATLLAQIGDPMAAAACAAWVHGRAARLTQGRASNARGFTLEDLLAQLTRAWSVQSGPSRYPVLFELPPIVSR
jgi:hydroxyethylthiazole kinase-like uncharacterized protein yjeF